MIYILQLIAYDLLFWAWDNITKCQIVLLCLKT
jgi:hypothetical protein